MRIPSLFHGLPEAALDWPLLRVLLAWLVARLGGPTRLMARRSVSAALGRALRGVLSDLESAARKLLAAMARDLPEIASPEIKAISRKRRGARTGHGRGGFAHAGSENWPVRFALAPPVGAGAPRPSSRRRRPLFARPIATAALAERLEALLRVAADPAPHAAQLARRLQSKACLPNADPYGAPLRERLAVLDASAPGSVAGDGPSPSPAPPAQGRGDLWPYTNTC